MPAFDRNRALTLLRDGVRDRLAEFRRGQAEAIEHVVTGAGRLLVVQKTGWGKSFVYFIATKMLRESGPTLLVRPLLALMRNQIAAAERMGVNAETINSNNPTRWHEIEEALRHDQIDILLIAPERLANDRFRDGVLAEIAGRISLLVIDEAHCISDWGHDFRPHYRLIERTIRLLPPNLRLLATTATANDRVTDDLAQILGPNLAISRGDLRRPSLALQTIRMPSRAGRFADTLVGAGVDAVGKWAPEPKPEWVTAIPSRRHPELVPNFARRLSVGLGLPYRDVLGRKTDRPEQKTMQNSDQQARNVIGSLAVERSAILPKPVLLVDDMVDSRWTFTVAARLLRAGGSGAVWPFALADAAGTR